MDAAVGFCQHLLDWLRAVLIVPSRRHWDIFTALCADIRGPLVADAFIAALAIEYGCELITTDSDFSRFAWLTLAPSVRGLGLVGRTLFTSIVASVTHLPHLLN